MIEILCSYLCLATILMLTLKDLKCGRGELEKCVSSMNLVTKNYDENATHEFH